MKSCNIKDDLQEKVLNRALYQTNIKFIYVFALVNRINDKAEIKEFVILDLVKNYLRNE